MRTSPSRSLCAALLTVPVAAGGVSAQAAATWIDLVQMPVAVARLELAGVPVSDLRIVIPALNVATVAPDRFLESLRAFPFLAYRGNAGEGPGLGEYVGQLHARGLRGVALAEAIHRELRSRGVPAGPKRRGLDAHDVLHDDFLPPGLRSRIREERDRSEAGPARGPRGEGGKGGEARGRDAPDEGRGRPGKGPDARRRGPPDRGGGPPRGARGPGGRGAS